MRGGGLSCEESFPLMILGGGVWEKKEEEEGAQRRTGRRGEWTEDVHTH